jgi:soluble cytochrome b562
MINKKRVEEMMKVADDAMASTIKELPKMIKSKTSGVIAAMFGFERSSSWGEWKIDHCNGRQSEISEWMSHRAKKIFRDELEKTITKKFVKDVIKETKAKAAIQKEFKEQFLYQFKRHVVELAKKHAEEEAKKYMEGFRLSLASQIDEIAQAAMSGNVSETQIAIMEAEVEDNSDA